MAETNKIESLSDYQKEPGGEYNRWIAEIAAAEKELGDFWKRSRLVVKEYRAKRVEPTTLNMNTERKFNLFAANVNIMATSLLNQVPKPTVTREFKDMNDDVGRIACTILERALTAHNARNYCTYDILKCVVQDHLVPGVGVSWHTYDAEIEHRKEEPSADILAVNPEAKVIEYDEVIKEEINDEYVYWEDLIWSPARTWEEVRWVGRKAYMTRDKLTKRFGAKVGKEVSLDYSPKKVDNRVDTENQVFQQAVIYEVWNKDDSEVVWFSKNYDKLLDRKEDFLKLDDFFPCPKFLTATVSNGQYVPIPDYHYASDQYRELNEINTRISLLVRACRVAGVYDKASSALQALVNNAAENTLVPVDQWAAFAEKGGIKGVVDWLPLDQIVKCLEQLLKNREDVKAQIYEITGMADIIRGQSKASETLGAQKIKAQYASMRIQDRQKAVVEYCSSMFSIQAQLMRKHMDLTEILKLAQVEYMNEDPDKMQQAIQLVKDPNFVLRSRVESDTLSDIDFQAEKQDRLEYMSTITNYLKEMLPAIQGDPFMGPFLLQLLQFSLAGFKVGKNFEAELDRTFAQMQQQLSQPQPPQPSPEQMKVEAQIEGMKQEQQLKREDHQAEMQFKREEHQMDMQEKRDERQFKIQEAQFDVQIAQGKLAQAQRDAMVNSQIKQQEAATQIQVNRELGAQKIQQGEQAGAQKLQQGEAQFAQRQAQARQTAAQTARTRPASTKRVQ